MTKKTLADFCPPAESVVCISTGNKVYIEDLKKKQEQASLARIEKIWVDSQEKKQAADKAKALLLKMTVKQVAEAEKADLLLEDVRTEIKELKREIAADKSQYEWDRTCSKVNSILDELGESVRNEADYNGVWALWLKMGKAKRWLAHSTAMLEMEKEIAKMLRELHESIKKVIAKGRHEESPVPLAPCPLPSSSGSDSP